MNKKSTCIICVVLTVIAFLTIGLPFIGANYLNKRVEKNKELADDLKGSLAGKTYLGSNREYGKRSGGAVSLMEFTDTKVVCEFGENGKAYISITESFCDGTAAVADGNIIYDRSRTKERDESVGEVRVTNSGGFEVLIGEKKYPIVVAEDRFVTAIIIEGTMCELQE